MAGIYTFSKPTAVELEGVDVLDEVQQHQFVQGAEAYSGDSYDDVATAIPKLIEQFEDVSLERYAILRDGAPAYEMWVFNTDNGMVFPCGSSAPTAVHCSQSRFWSVDDDDQEAIALAAALNEVVPF